MPWWCKIDHTFATPNHPTRGKDWKRNKQYQFIYTLSLFDFLSFLAHLSHSDKVSFCDHILSIVRRAYVHPSIRKQFLQTTSLPKPLIGFWPNFTGMILGWSSFKVIQTVPVHCISRSQELKIDFLTKNFSETRRPRSLIFGMWLHLVDLYQSCSNYSPGIKNSPAPGVTCFT